MSRRCICGKFIGKDHSLCESCFANSQEEAKREEQTNAFINSEIVVDSCTYATHETHNESLIDGFVINGDGTATGQALSKNRPYSLDEIIDMWKIDTKKWEPMAPLKANCWPTTNGKGESYMNYQTKVNFRPRRKIFDYDLIREDFKTFTKYYSPSWKDVFDSYDFTLQKEENLLELNIADLHLGKLCWSGETGENYDVKIATNRFRDVLNKLIKRVSGFDYNRIVFPIGNDFFNSDNLDNTTTKGTQQDEDLRWGKVYPIGRRLLVDAINFLSGYAPVDVVVVQGNHDFQRMFYVGDTLSAVFENHSHVTVNNSARVRKYYKYGQVLLGYTHGNEEKEANLPLIMAQECPEYWSETKFREIHLGHLHHRKEIKYQSTKEYTGIVVRYMRSLCGTEEWHARKGYVGNIKGSEAFLWNKETGLIGSFEVNLTV